MSTIHQRLAQRIRGELQDLDRTVERAAQFWERGRQSPDDQDMYLDSVALNLHSFYSGLERMFELIARHIDGQVPDSQHWHRDLLQRMTRDEEVRPAVISTASGDALDEFRRFRHLVRNVYTFNLVPEKMEPLVSRAPDVWVRVRAELLAFADFLEEVARASET